MTKLTPEGALSRREFMQGGLAVTGAMMLPEVAGGESAAVSPTTKRPNLLFIYGEGQRADAHFVLE